MQKGSITSGVRMNREVKEKYFEFLKENGTNFGEHINKIMKYELAHKKLLPNEVKK